MINDTFEQLVESKRPKSFLEMNPGALKDFVGKFGKMDARHVEQQLRYHLRMHDPSAPGSAVRKIVRAGLAHHKALQLAAAQSKAKPKAKK